MEGLQKLCRQQDGVCAFWVGSCSRTELGNVLPSARELCLVNAAHIPGGKAGAGPQRG